MFPPHLPPPTSSIPRHRQWQRIKIILVSSVFGVLAGMSGAAILIGWIWPVVNGNEGLLNNNRPLFTREQLQARAEAKISDKIFTIYKKSSTIGNAKYFSDTDKVGEGLLGVSSGWLVSRIPEFDGKVKDWVAVSSNGSLYSVERTLNDKKTGLVYLKISALGNTGEGEQFKVANFSNGLDDFTEVYVFQDGKWLNSLVMGQVPFSENSHLDSVLPLAYHLNDTFDNGSIVIDGQGNAVGFITSGSEFFPFTNINYFLNGIDGKNQIIYPSLGIEGWYGEEKLLIVNEEKTSGFIVAKVLGNKNVFQKGDIILQVNGRPADFGNVWNAVQGSKVRVSILRNGRNIESEVSSIQL